jgi:hypothetical protein
MTPSVRILPILAVLGLASAAHAGWFFNKNGCCCAEQGPVRLRADVTEHTRIEDVPVPPGPAARVTIDKQPAVSVQRVIPVEVFDPCTGCKHTEYRTQTVVESSRHAVIDVGCGEPRVEKKVSVQHCITITIDRLPAPGQACPGQ